MEALGETYRRRVRVLFGRHVIATYTADAKLADRYADAMRRRFYGLEIVVDDLAIGTERPVPCERLWDLAP